jgi:hypothetical protein
LIHFLPLFFWVFFIAPLRPFPRLNIYEKRWEKAIEEKDINFFIKSYLYFWGFLIFMFLISFLIFSLARAFNEIT